MEVNLVIIYYMSEDSIEVHLVISFVYVHAVPDVVPDKVLITDSFQKKNWFEIEDKAKFSNSQEDLEYGELS